MFAFGRSKIIKLEDCHNETVILNEEQINFIQLLNWIDYQN